MGLLTFATVLSLVGAGFAASEAGAQQPVDLALARDDECSPTDSECGLNALQRRTEKLDTEEETDEEEEVPEEEAADAPAPKDPDDVPLRVLNNASNVIVLANCHERYDVRPGEELQTELMVTGGYWVMPESDDFNCTTGCSDCFYMTMQWTVNEGASIRIGFGIEAQAEAAGDGEIKKPEGGGMAVSVSGSGSAQCTDESCVDGWTDPIPVDMDASTISVVIEGSRAAKQAGTGSRRIQPGQEVHAQRFGRVGGFRGGGFRGGGFRGGFGRPVFRRPIYRRPIFRRPIYRPVYRPIYRPIYTSVTTCAWCYQYGSGTCWWLCR